jgi:DNA-binding NtrC family response regulator
VSFAILVVEDDRILAKNLATYLLRQGYDVQAASTGSEGIRLLEQYRPDVALVDLMLPDMSGVEVLMRIRSIEPHIRVLMMTGAGSVQAAVDAMKAGAHDYLTKPLVLKELKLLVEKALADSKRAGALSYYQQREADQSGLDKIIGDSLAMRELRQKIRQFVTAESQLADQEPPTVLITGETGTGKELIARAFHFEGPRRSQPFVELNCAAIPGHLLEAELFGYERGAFTDAKQRKLGLVDAANEGTLFLDEIGEMEPSLQAKLLSLLENRRVRRLGSIQEHDVDVRVLAATNRDLDSLVRAGAFRSDLYYRLRVIQIAVPPLRERADDVLLLAEEFLSLQGARYGKNSMVFAPEAREKLLGHSWPGNVRELRNTLEQAVLLANADTIEAHHLLLGEAVVSGGNAPDTSSAAPPSVSFSLEQQEIHALKTALCRTGGNVTQAARLLGLSRDALRYRMAKYSLKA